ncbi:MAG: matrixin family metalloprotease [Pseudobdellovibrionaceae bacterium]
MHDILKRAVLSSGLLCLMACSQILGPGNEEDLATASEKSCGFVQNSYGQRVSWRPTVVTVYHSESIPENMKHSLQVAAQVWESILGRKIFAFESLPASEALVPRKDGRNALILLSDWPDSARHVQAITNVYYTGAQITEADIKVNMQDFSYSEEPLLNQADVHLASLLLHELGHALGLQHLEQLPTVMWPLLEPNVIRMKPSDQDRENIKCEY